MVLLNGPVQNAWFCFMDQYRNVCVWFMARNFRFPKVGTLCCQRGNHRLPLQGTAMPVPRGWNSWFPTWEPEVTIASNCPFLEVGTHASQRGNHRVPLQGTSGSQRLELSVANLGPTGYHCKEVPFPRGWNLVPNLGTRGDHCKQLPVPKGWNSLLPTWEPQVTIARNCRFPEDGTLGSQPGNQRLPLQATAGSKRLELTLPNLGTTGYHCKELPVPRI